MAQKSRRAADVVGEQCLERADAEQRGAHPDHPAVAPPPDHGGHEDDELEADDDAADDPVDVERLRVTEDERSDQIDLHEDHCDHRGSCGDVERTRDSHGPVQCLVPCHDEWDELRDGFAAARKA